MPEPLRRAMRLLDEGKFGESAEAFEDLAQEAEERGKICQAANLTAQAARCYLRLDDIDQAYDRGKRLLISSNGRVGLAQPGGWARGRWRSYARGEARVRPKRWSVS